MVILLADDDPEDFEIFREAISEINPKIVCQWVSDGDEVVPFIQNSIIRPDLIFLDINMPMVDGKECLRRLKSDREMKEIPVVVYTTSTRAKDKEEVQRLGALDYIIKPSSFSEVLVSMKKVLKV